MQNTCHAQISTSLVNGQVTVRNEDTETHPVDTHSVAVIARGKHGVMLSGSLGAFLWKAPGSSTLPNR